MFRFYSRRFLRRLIGRLAYRWYDWLYGANGVEGGDGYGSKTLIEFGTIDPDPTQPDRPPMVGLQVGLAVIPGPRIVARTFLSPADAYDFFSNGIKLIEEQMTKFGDAEPRRFDTSQVKL